MSNRNKLGMVAVCLLALGFMVAPASAALLYDNGPLAELSDYYAFTINYGYQVTDSFTIGSNSTLTSAQVGLWMLPGDVPGGVDWSIGSSAYGSDISSGTSAFSNIFQDTNDLSYDVYESTFSLTGSLAPGTYWLTLQNATTPDSDPMYWNENNGPSAAYETAYGAVPSESFQIYGDTGRSIPEPATTSLLIGVAAVGLFGMARKQRKATNAA